MLTKLWIEGKPVAARSGKTSLVINPADGALRVASVNPAMVDSHCQQQIDGISLQQLVRLNVEQLRQLTKVALLLSTISGLTVEDDDIEPIIY